MQGRGARQQQWWRRGRSLALLQREGRQQLLHRGSTAAPLSHDGDQTHHRQACHSLGGPLARLGALLPRASCRGSGPGRMSSSLAL